MSDTDPTVPALRLDLRGLKCPLPVLHARRALARCAPGTTIEIACTDPLSVIDIPAMALQDGHGVEQQGEDRGVYRFRLRAGSKP